MTDPRIDHATQARDHDTVYDEPTGQSWDLDDSDYTDTGSTA